MGKARRLVRYLSYQEIVNINREIIFQSGGFLTHAGEVRNPNSLSYLIEIVRTKFADKELYPSLAQKAAVYAFDIITRSIFHDGNKRTGMACAFLFLRLNGCILSESIPEEEIVELALQIANREVDIAGVAGWILKWLET